MVTERGIGREVEGGEQLGEEEPGAEAAVDLDGGFPAPAEAGIRSKIALQHRAGIDVIALGAAEFLELRIEESEAFFDEIVVVFVPRIAGDTVVRGVAFGERVGAGMIVQREADDSAAAG